AATRAGALWTNARPRRRGINEACVLGATACSQAVSEAGTLAPGLWRRAVWRRAVSRSPDLDTCPSEGLLMRGCGYVFDRNRRSVSPAKRRAWPMAFFA